MNDEEIGHEEEALFDRTDRRDPEAAAAGSPVVGGNRDGSIDALAEGEIGTPVDPHDLRQLTEVLAQALTNPKRASEAALERFAFSNFDAHIDKNVARLQANVRDLP